jgi:ferredoxin
MSLVTNWLESLSYDLEISAACLKKISPASSCTVCLDECPEHAVFIDGGKIFIDKELCTSCGTCITTCPVQAIKGQSPSRKVIQKYILLQEESILPTIPELFYYHKKGIRSIHKSSKDDVLVKLVQTANESLKAMELEPLRVADELILEIEDQPKLTRRDLFNKLRIDSKKNLLSSVTPVKWRFNEDNFKISNLFDGWAFFEVRIHEESCTLCGGCFNICPSKVFEPNDRVLTIHEENCSGCNLCMDICQSSAVQISKDIHQQPAPMKYWHQSICSICGSSFHSWTAKDTCHICSTVEKPTFFL